MLDPDLEIRKGRRGEGGGRSSRPLDKLDEDGRRFPPNIFFPPFGPQFGLKKEGRAAPPGRSPGSATGGVAKCMLFS